MQLNALACALALFLGLSMMPKVAPASFGEAMRPAPSMELTLSSPSATTVPYGQVGLALRLRNTGTEAVPFSPEILGRPHGGARLWVEVANSASDPKQSKEVFVPEPTRGSGDAVPIALLAPHGEAGLKFELGAKLFARDGQEAALIAAFPSPGCYVVIACYEWNAQIWRSDPLSITCNALSPTSASALTQLKALKDRAYWVYEPQMIPLATQLDELSDIAALAAVDTEWGDYAKFALAWHFGEQAMFARVDAQRFGASSELARDYLTRMRENGYPFDTRLRSLRDRLTASGDK